MVMPNINDNVMVVFEIIEKIKEKIIGWTGSISGIASILGSWQICHNVCLVIVALLGILGITVVGMPLAFLTEIAVPIWTVAFILLLITIILYIKKKCISKQLLLFNTWLIIAGIPFQSLQKFSVIFWVVGGLIAAAGIYLFIKSKLNTKNEKKKEACH